MGTNLKRREFIQAAAAAGAFAVAGPCVFAAGASPALPTIISPGCRTSKVRVAKLYVGSLKGHWPTPTMDIKEEVKRYQEEFVRMKKDFADVEFVCDELVTTVDQAKALKDKLADVDGILVIHLSMGISPILNEILSAAKPTMLYAAPYSGHEWAGFGALRNKKEGALFDCVLTSDFNQLAVAIRPIRAIHHMREAKILNVTSRPLPEAYLTPVKEKFGTTIVKIERERTLDAYNSIPDAEAKAEAKRWTRNASKIVEPSEEEIFKSCKLALAFQKLMDEENATVITVDCYGSMYRQLPAFPCIGLTRLDDLGLGGVCESDLSSAVTGILLQSLSGRPAFVSDPTVDESKKSIILAHCRCATKMDGPDGKAASYKLRTIMERQEGCVAHVKLRVGQKVTQALLLGAESLIYFTGDVIEVPDTERGCRTKINVKVDGDIEKLWHNWSHGLHRQTCYGDLLPDLTRWCRFKGIAMVNEAI
ncbi:MAG: hypothetical protein NTX50_10975 [Candidatus Sumerlaeota bacterium]|nr:hypothetical protein [Candidatus Sumerlaeota bacterium]